jgi:competence protein ComEC
MRLEQVEVTILNPPPAEWQRVRVRNDDSVVLQLRYGCVRILLPGDISAEAERGLTPDARGGVPALTIVKSPHHGSAGSSSEALLDAFRPSLVTVSAGHGNRFGHPAAVTLARYAARSIPVLRTDVSGAVALVTDGHDARAFTWGGSHWMPAWRWVPHPGS